MHLLKIKPLTKPLSSPSKASALKHLNQRMSSAPTNSSSKDLHSKGPPLLPRPVQGGGRYGGEAGNHLPVCGCGVCKERTKGKKPKTK